MSKEVNKFWILVEAMGHVNFGRQMETDFKGLLRFGVRVVPAEGV